MYYHTLMIEPMEITSQSRKAVIVLNYNSRYTRQSALCVFF